MAGNISRSERLMTKLGNVAGVSPEGLEWLKASLDPYHDEPINCRGMPVGDEASSVVQVIKQSINVAANSGNSGNYDCYITCWPWESYFDIEGNSLALTPVSESPTGFFQSTAGQIHCNTGGITCTSVTANATYTVQTPPQVALAPPSRYLQGVYRVIAKGFEIYNTTSELTVQGSITSWRQPTPSPNAAQATVSYVDGQTVGGTIFSGWPTILPINPPPLTTAQALLLEGTKEWLSKDGAYHVCTINELYPPPIGGSYVQPYINQSGTTSGFFITPFTTTVGSLNIASPLKIPWGNFNMQGSILTGLSNTTTLRIDATWYIERFPSNFDLDLAVLATRAPDYDVQALQCYSHAINKMPVAVPVKENGLGDWFKDVVSSVSDYVAPVLSMIPHPAAQGLSMGIKGIDRIANSSKYQPPSGDMGSVKQTLAKMEVKAKNSQVKAKNAITRAKNEEIRARKAAKAAKGK